MNPPKFSLTSRLSSVQKFFSSNQWRPSSSQTFEFQMEQLEPRIMLAADLGGLIFQANFEDVTVGPGQFGFFAEVSGLTATAAPVEVQNNPDSVGPASQGRNHLELDGVNGVFVELAGETVTDRLILKVDYSTRPKISMQQSAVEVYWNGTLIQTLAADGTRNRSTDFHEFEIELPSTSGRLEFRSNSPNDVLGLGGLIDNVRVYEQKGSLALSAIADQNIPLGGQLDIYASLLPPNQNLPGAVYSLSGQPVGMQINAQTGQITWAASQSNVDNSSSANDEIKLGDPILQFKSSFEDVDVVNGGFDFFATTSGFTATGSKVEVQDHHASVGAASDGDQLLELDGLNGIYRDVTTITGDKYELVFDYSARPRLAGEQNAIEVWWNGSLLDSVVADGARLRRPKFNEYRFDLSSFSEDLTRLEFRSNSPNDQLGLGGLLDNVRLYRRPVETIEGQSGRYNIIVTVTDPEGRTDTEKFQVTVGAALANQPPILANIPAQTVKQNRLLQFTATATDPDLPANTLIFGLTGTVPAGAVIDPSTGKFNWTPTETIPPGDYELIVTVNDGQGGSDSQTVNITVISAGDAILLAERHHFESVYSEEIVVAEGTNELIIEFADEFDKTDPDFINDAFEIALLDQASRSLVHTFADDRDAFFNFTEDESISNGVNTVAMGSTVHLDLSHIAAGTTANLVFRLVNNDTDTNTKVRINSISTSDTILNTPIGASFSAKKLHSNEPINFDVLSDITGSLDVNYHQTSFNHATSTLFTTIGLTNIGQVAIAGRMLAVFENPTSELIQLVRPDGRLPDGRFFVELTAENGILLNGQTTTPHALALLNPAGELFNFELTILAAINSSPSGFNSIPPTEMEAGRTLTYFANATDPEGQPLKYSVIVGDENIAINEDTGELTWVTTAADIGSHVVSIRATDPFGLFVEQTFKIDVLLSLQNRPPNFVSDPVTDAIASSGFEITTLATGDNPNGVGVISGFQGPRIVTINAGEQTIGVYAGQNNDRFDNATSYSTGEPQPTDAVFQQGYSIDVGLPNFLRTTDANSVLGMDQGDLNGDGILDLVALTFNFDSAASGNARYQYQLVQLLGDGDGNFGDPIVVSTLLPQANNNIWKHLRLADTNNDGNLDIHALRESGNDSLMVTMMGNGDGTFGSLVVANHIVALNDYRLEDLDVDGNLDIIGRNVTGTNLGWMRGAGDGTFGDFVEITTGGAATNNSAIERPYQIVDIDGDGDRDIVVAKSNLLGIDVLINDGSENFSVMVNLPSGLSGNEIVQVADFTGDGKLDILVSQSNEVDLYVNDGTSLAFTLLKSGQLDSFSGNSAGHDAPLDIDGDGDLDLVVGGSFRSNGFRVDVQVLLNDGTGVFSNTAYALTDFVGQSSQWAQDNESIAEGVLVGDYNRDGVLDLSYYTSGARDFNGVGVILGTRPGEFASSHTTPLRDSADRSLHASDFNGDGIVDLLSLRSGDMYLGHGNGTFADPIPSVQVDRPDAYAAIADFNLDGLPDFVAARASTMGSRYYVALANGDGTFTVSDDQLVESSFYGYQAFEIADFNNDGYPDFIAKTGVERQVDLHLNNPDAPGTFARSYRVTIDAQGVNASGFTDAFTVGDFNGDGNTDIALADRLPGEPMKLVLYAGDGQGQFAVVSELFGYGEDQRNWGQFYSAGNLSSSDFNEDGHLDIASFTNAGTLVFVNNGNGTFTATDRYPAEALGNGGKGRQFYTLDFDEDGHVDMVQIDNLGTVNVRRGLGDGTFAETMRVGLMSSSNEATFADLDHDGHLDLALATVVSNFDSAALYFGARDGLVDMLSVDLNGDGNEEILAINEANDRMKLFVGDNLGNFTRQVDLLTGRAPKAVAVADFNGDGQLELIAVNRAGRSISVFSGSIATGYTSVEYPLANGAVDVAAADLDNDGNVDLVALDDTANALWIYNGNGTNTLGTPVAVAIGDVPDRLTLADATGDGKFDAIITLPNSNRLMILSEIGFQPVSPPIYVELSSSPSDVQVVDLNDDGNPDLVATLADENVLSILYGRGNNQFARAQNISVGDRPTRVTLADADKDGRTDLIVANSGDNTVSVIYNRFDPNEVYRYDSDAIDPDNDTLTYAIVDGPGGLIINSTTGALLWAASPDQVGVHDVTISANDGRGGVATQSFKIGVQPARENAVPLIATEPMGKIGAGETFTYKATAVDNDRDTIRYRLIDAPAGATIDPTTGLVQWDGLTDQAIGINLPGFNGMGEIEIPADSSLQPASLTVEGWYNFSQLPANNGAAVIFQQNNAFGNAYQLWNNGNTRLRLEMDFGAGQNDQRYFADFVPETDRWYHFALTIDDASKTAKVYVDGQEVMSAIIPASIAYDPTKYAQVGTSSVSMIGRIDNYRIWNTVRTPAEIVEGMGRQYDGNSAVVLDYRFDLPNTINVRDFSPAGNHGNLIRNQLEPQLAPGLANPGLYHFTIGVEDGRGGKSTQSFDVEIVPELRGNIVGTIFDDANGDGIRNDGTNGPAAETLLANWLAFIDVNGNDFADPGEQQSVTDANGYYHFEHLLPGDYPVKIDPVAGFETPILGSVNVSANQTSSVNIAAIQRALSQIQGQLKTADGQTIGYWKVYADLDHDGTRGTAEPTAMTDRNGTFAIYGLDAGTYTVRAELPAGWKEAAAALVVDLAADEIAIGNDISVSPTNPSVIGGVHFVTTPPTTIEARDVFRYASVATTIVPQAITYDVSLAPAGLTVDPTSGLVAWRPTISQVGDHLVILRATDAAGSISLHDFTVTVIAPNTAPVIGTTAPIVGYVGRGFDYNLAAQDAEQESISFTLIDGPATATLDPNSGQLRWTPATADIGVVNFEIEARDASGKTATQTFAVTISADQPVVTPFNITAPRASIGLGQTYISQIVGVDQLNRTLTWTLANGPTGLTINEHGIINWIVGASDLGQRSVELTATSVDGETENYSFNINVVGRPIIHAPQIVSKPTLSSAIGDEYRYDVRVEDTNNNLFTYSLLAAPIGMSIHPSNGTIRWTPSADQLGESDVLIEVTNPDGAATTQAFKLKVSRSGGPPIITSIPPTEVNVGGSYLYSVVAKDAEGDPLSYRLLTAPAGVTIVETTGEISWTPTLAQLGQQAIVIEVSDGVGGAATQSFAILVGDGIVNLPPSITSSASRFSAVGSNYSYQIVATDPESTNLNYSVSRGPNGMSVDGNGLVSWTPAIGQTGKFVVTLVVTDAGGASAIESFELDVLAENRAPVINSTAPVKSVKAAGFRYDVLVTDADRDQLKFELIKGPVAATINSFGQIRWNNSAVDLGSYNFEVKVTDPRGGEASQAFAVELVADTESPKLSLLENLGDGNRNILPWSGPFKVFARAVDNVAVASLTLSANGQEIALSSDGSATFTFEDWGFTHINATATAIDTSGNVTTKTISFDYDFPQGWSGTNNADIPTAIITNPADHGTAVGMVSIVGTAAHDDFAAYQLSYRHVSETSFTDILRSETAVENGELGVWDTSLLLNDEYVIRLEVATTAGVVNVVEHNVGLAGNLKLGNFRLSFTDMLIPVAGIPIEITRVYDTLQSDVEGDFGYGWRLEYRDTNLQVGLPKSGLEDIGIYSALRPGTKVYLNVPGQGRQGFTFNPDIRVLPGFGGTNLTLARPRFTPDRGVTSTLSTGTSAYLQVNEQGELFAPGGIPYNPASPDFGGAYTLTTRDGVSYRIDGQGQLSRATDVDGNTLTFSDSGILGPDGMSVDFLRDRNGRITSVVEPSGTSRIQYQYSEAGDLISVTDRADGVSRFAYDAARPHYLVSVVDPLGRTGIRSEYDLNGRLSRVIDSNGNVSTVSFDPANQLISTQDSLGRTTFVEYDNQGNIVQTIDALGHSTKLTYDSLGNTLTQTDALGRTTKFTYDLFNNPTSVTDPTGAVTKTIYDSDNNPIASTDALGHTSRTSYDSAGNAVTITDENGTITNLNYFKNGRLKGIAVPGGINFDVNYGATGPISGTDWNGLQNSAAYDANGREISRSTTANGVTFTESVTRDAAGRVLTQVNAAGGTTRFEYDIAGQLLASVAPTGARTTYAYDGSGQLVTLVLADGSRLENEYDLFGRRISQTDAAGRKTRYTYDDANRLVSTIYPDSTPADDSDNPRIRTEYDAVGQVVATFDELGRASNYQYDLAGRLVAVTDALGRTLTTQYDIAGRIVSQTDPLNRKTEYSFDPAGRSTERVLADGSSLKTTVNERGLPIETATPLGHATRYEYTPSGQVAAVTDPLGARTEYLYNERGKLVTQIDANGHITEFEYNSVGQETARLLPGGERWQTAYDNAGRVLSTTDPDGRVVRFDYDLLDHLAAKTLPDGSVVTYRYTAAGQIASIAEDRGATLFEYDDRDRLVRKTEPDGQSISYQYDLAGQLIKRTTLAGAVSFDYDSAGQLIEVTDQVGGVTTYTYDVAGQVIKIEFPNNVVEHRTYDLLGRLFQVSSDGPAGVITDFRYTLDADGRVILAEELDRTVAYSYDAAARLVSERTTGNAGINLVGYQYDAVGNRLTRTADSSPTQYEYDINDRLIRSTDGGVVTTYEYDDAGNLVSAITGGDRIDYRWDGEGRLSAVTVTNNGIAITESYRYDDSGTRIAIIANDGSETRLLVDYSAGLSYTLAEYTASGILISSQLGNVEVRNGEVKINLSDRLGSVRVVTDLAGDVLSRFDYDAYGLRTDSSGSAPSSLGFAGEPRSAATDLDYLRARYFSSSTGRFISADPFVGLVGKPISRHRYQYADLNPVSNVDPSGLATLAERIVVDGISKTLLKVGARIQTAKNAKEKADNIIGIAESVYIFGAAIGTAAIYTASTVGIGALGGYALAKSPDALTAKFNPEWNAKNKKSIIQKASLSFERTVQNWSVALSLEPGVNDGEVAPAVGFKYVSTPEFLFTGEAGIGFGVKLNSEKGFVYGFTFKEDPDDSGFDLAQVTFSGKIAFEGNLNQASLAAKFSIELAVLSLFKFELEVYPGLVPSA